MADALNLDAARLAIIGLRGALDRHYEAYIEIDFQKAGVSAVELMNWACALDDRLRRADTGYEARREDTIGGRFLPGMRYVRDRHMHQVVLSHGAGFSLHFEKGDPHPKRLSSWIIWRSADEIGDPPKRYQKTNYDSERQRYVDLMQGRYTSYALSGAVEWCTGEVERLKIELPPWNWPRSR